MADFLPLQIPPGVFRSGNEYQAKGRWYDTNLVRWYDGVALGPILGWQTKSTSTLTGKARAILTWRDNGGTRRAAVGTHSKLYVMGADGAVNDITPAGFTTGRADAEVPTGYGFGGFGTQAYGTPRSDTGILLDATMWDLDTWGQFLVGCSPDDGKLYEWQLSSVAAAIANAPTGCNGLVVTPQRFLMAIGASGNPRKLQWSGQGDNTVWTPAATNQAGSLEIPVGKLICGRVVGDQVLLLSDVEAHVADYVGLPFVFSRRKVGDACGAVSKRCIAVAGGMAAWWSRSGFWIYDGAVRPLNCPVWDDLLRNLTIAQRSKVSAFRNVKNSEFWWFYPSSGGTEITNYVMWNYKHDHWAVGALVRLAGAEDGVFETPFLTGDDGNVYDHEIGYSYGGTSPSARSGPIELGSGDRVMHVLGIVPDEKTAGDVTVSFRKRHYPNAAEMVLGSTVLTGDGKADLRFSARQVEIVVTGSTPTNWRWGQPRLALAAGGKR